MLHFSKPILFFTIFLFFSLINTNSSSQEEACSAPPSRAKACAFCSCEESTIWFRDVIKSYGPALKTNQLSPTASNGIFRPYLAKSETSSRSSQNSSPERRDSPSAETLPMHVGYFYRTPVTSIVDVEQLIWAHHSCLEWSKCTAKGCPSDNVLLVTAIALAQVFFLTFFFQTTRLDFFLLICFLFIFCF